MPDQTDHCAETLRRKLELFGEQVKDLRSSLDSAESSPVGIKREIAAAEVAMKRIRDDALAARARMQLQEEERALADSGQVEAWKRDREVELLKSRAEDAEAYAAWSLIVATRAISEVKLATLKAIAARSDFRAIRRRPLHSEARYGGEG